MAKIKEYEPEQTGKSTFAQAPQPEVELQLKKPIIPIKVAERGQIEAEKNALRISEATLAQFMKSNDRDFQEFLRNSETKAIITNPANFRGAGIRYAKTTESDIYSVEVNFKGLPRILTVAVGNNALSLILTDKEGNLLESMTQKGEKIEYVKKQAMA